MPTTVKKETTKPAAAHHAAKPAKSDRYIEAIGRRKTAIARVRIVNGTGKVSVNGKESGQYFVTPRIAAAALAPLDDLKIRETFDVSAKVSGGGIKAQAEAIRLGIARAIVEKNEAWKKRLRVSGYLTRDPRMVERKKYGLKKARRRPQWAKR
ncbi:MAG: 30S ribosomal protein S9 [Patescibacteria group bacterium]|nr:30S ribosomal protein S9 [Patescibacteria group bacterium]